MKGMISNGLDLSNPLEDVFAHMLNMGGLAMLDDVESTKLPTEFDDETLKTETDTKDWCYGLLWEQPQVAYDTYVIWIGR